MINFYFIFNYFHGAKNSWWRPCLCLCVCEDPHLPFLVVRDIHLKIALNPAHSQADCSEQGEEPSSVKRDTGKTQDQARVSKETCLQGDKISAVWSSL